MIRILFVCHGNICRSPMAEFVMKKLVQNANRQAEFHIESAATSSEEIGNPVYPPARRMLERHGIDASGKTARRMTVRDMEAFDYIVLMDGNNLRNLRGILSEETFRRECLATANDPRSRRFRKISLLMDYTDTPRDVADPWYTGDFEATWRDVKNGCEGFLAGLDEL